MTRDETVAVLGTCEAKRSEARGAGKSEDEAHEAATAHWNAWAEPLLTERKAMEADGRWVAERQHPQGPVEPRNDETRAWMNAALVDLSRCLFLVEGAEGTEETPGQEDDAEALAPPLRSIAIDDNKIDFRGFVFPGDV